MTTEGPLLETLTRRLAECPADFLAEPGLGGQGAVNVAAVLNDLMRELGGAALGGGQIQAIRQSVNASDLPITSVHLGESPEEVEMLARGTGPWPAMLKAVGAWRDDWAPPATGPQRRAMARSFSAYPNSRPQRRSSGESPMIPSVSTSSGRSRAPKASCASTQSFCAASPPETSRVGSASA